MLNLVGSGSMDKQEPIADVEQKIGLTEKPKEQVITLLPFKRFLIHCFYVLFTLFADCVNLLSQPVPSKDEKATLPPISVDSNVINIPCEGQTQAGTSNIDGDHNAAYPHNFYASQAQPFYYQGQLAYRPLFTLCVMSPFFVTEHGLMHCPV